MESSMIYTVGHSTHTNDEFIGLLKSRQINAIGDVRSAPYSRYQPHFNREIIQKTLADANIAYAFLGDSIGGRSLDQNDYENGRVVYARLKESFYFQNGIERVIEGAKQFKLALMCSEKEPIDCHRTLLVGQTLVEMGQEVIHILGDGSLEKHHQSIQRLLKVHKLDKPDLFRTDEEIIQEALLKQEQKVAFVLDDPVRGRLGFGQLGASDNWTETV